MPGTCSNADKATAATCTAASAVWTPATVPIHSPAAAHLQTACAGTTLGQVQRTRDRMNFLLVLVEIASEVVSKYQAVFGVVGAFLVAQAVYLMWWAWVLEAVLTSSQTSAGMMPSGPL